MQKPFTMASVGKGSAAMTWNMSQPRRMMAMPSSILFARAKSLMSAPAMKPESLPERKINARGLAARISCRIAISSAIASAAQVMADSSALSSSSPHGHGAPLAAADANRGDAQLRPCSGHAGAPQPLEQVKDDARAGRTHRMAERDGAARSE